MKYSFFVTSAWKLAISVITYIGTSSVVFSQEHIDVYPVPHKYTSGSETISAQTFTLASQNADKDATALLKTHFPHSAKGFPIIIGEKKNMEKNQEYKSLAADIPNVNGAYKISISSSRIILIGNDGIGSFYAAQTLTQLLQKKGDKYEFSSGNILDWPDIPFRGTVEGFYGRPWQYEDRVSQLEFYGKYKLNTYIYGPKDDPFHGFSNRWREPYPENQARQLAELVKIAAKNKVNFVWAVHPGRDIQWGEKDEEACIKKFEMMYKLGVRSFAVFFDDIGGEGAKAEGQIKFLNRINRDFIHKKPDVSPLIMCPTQYNRAWSGGEYLPKLGAELDKDIRIMWTGNSVVADIKKADLEWINERIERPAFIWWNFPVSDYVRSRLLIGRIYGLEKGTQKDMSGFTSNPMDKPEASKIALFSIADYTWNQETFDSEKSWKEGIKHLFPGYSEAIQTLANHNSDPGPSAHGYRREESAELVPVLDKFMEEYRKAGKIQKSDELKQIQTELRKIAEAPPIIRSKSNNKALLREIEPWLVNFEALGKYGMNALELAKSVAEPDHLSKSLDSLLKTIHEMDAIEESSQSFSQKINQETGDKWQTSIQSGALRLKPAIDEIMDLSSAQFYSRISGRPGNIRRPYLSSSYTNGIEKMQDDNPASYFYCQEIQKTGDYFGLDLGNVQEIKTVSVLTGRKEGDHDAIHKGQLEISRDGEKWEPLMPESSGLHITYEGKGSKARYVRYRITHAGVPGGKTDVWTAIRDFRVNAAPSSSVTSNIPGLAKMVVVSDNKSIHLNPLLEVIPFPRKQFFGLSLPSVPHIASVSMNLDVDDYSWAKTEVTYDGKSWRALSWEKREDNRVEAPINSQIKGIRVLNQSNADKEIKISEFKLNLPADTASSSLAMDGKFTTKCPIKLTSEPFIIPVDFSPISTAYFFTKGAKVKVMVQDNTGKWKKAGEIKSSPDASMTALNLKSIPKGIRAIGFIGETGDELILYEVIFK